MALPHPAPSLRSIAAIELGTGRLLYCAGTDLTAVLADCTNSEVRITDEDGGPLSPEEHPLAAARAGRPYPARVLRLWHGETPTDVIASVARARTGEGGDANIALITAEPAAAADDQSAAERDMFLNIATHELRSPIASLQLDLERLRRRLVQSDTVRGMDVAREMERALRQVTRLTLLIQNLLDVSRMRTRQFALAIEEGDLCTVVREMLDALASQVSAAGGEIVVTSCESIHGTWDRLRLEQVLHNLVSNALKYGGHGKTIHVEIERDGDDARLTVRDEGAGVPAADRLRIFEPFQRGAGKSKVDAEATHSLGLGLYIVREIVAAHGGDVHVEGAETGGARFVVRLPIRTANPNARTR